MYCHKCGKELQESSHYCKYCGEEQLSYKLANIEVSTDSNTRSNNWNYFISSTGFKIYLLLLALWVIAWIQDWFDIINEDYVSLTITFFIITPLVINWWLIKLIKRWIKNKK